MADNVNLFALPTAPEGFAVLLPPAELRKLDFSALEFATSRRAVIEYIKTYFPNDFNDFVANNGVMMLIELCSYLTSLLSLRSDLLSNEGFLPTAKSEEAVVNHLALIGQKIRQASPASVDIECSVSSPVSSDIRISPSSLSPFEVRGSDGSNITYELYSAPGDITSDIIIPAGKRSVIAYGIEGMTKNATVLSNGQADQVFDTYDINVLEEPVRVYVTVGTGLSATTTEWTRVDYIEKVGPTDKCFAVRFLGDRFSIVFGNNTYGAIPEVGASIKVIYRTGGGVKGRIGAGVIDTDRPIVPMHPYTAPVQVRFRNISTSSGGTDKETIDQARKRAPREYSTHNAAITDRDYANLAAGFAHPVFGSVNKAVAAVRTGLNANRVEVYVLAAGPDGQLQQPNEGLKRAITTYLDDINVITDSVAVRPGYTKGVDVKLTVVMNRNYDSSVVKSKVEDAISKYFDLSQWDMGQSLYISSLYETIKRIDGVLYVDLYAPYNNVLSTDAIIVSRSGSVVFRDGGSIDDTVTNSIVHTLIIERADGKTWTEDGFGKDGVITINNGTTLYTIDRIEDPDPRAGITTPGRIYAIHKRSNSEPDTCPRYDHLDNAVIKTVENNGIAKNEVIVLGNIEVNYYYEQVQGKPTAA